MDYRFVGEFFSALDRHYLPTINRATIVELIENGAWDVEAAGGSVSFDASDADLCQFLADTYADEFAGEPGWD
jgi:hypothetical protein